MKLYTIRDKKMDTYLVPMYVDNIIQIQRDIQKIQQTNPSSNYVQFATDYEIYYLGEFNEQRATHSLLENPTFEMNVSELLTKEAQNA